MRRMRNHTNYCKQAKVRSRGWDFAKRAHEGVYDCTRPGGPVQQGLKICRNIVQASKSAEKSQKNTTQTIASKSACQRLGFCKAGTRWECMTVLDRVARCGKVPRSAAISCKQAKVQKNHKKIPLKLLQASKQASKQKCVSEVGILQSGNTMGVYDCTRPSGPVRQGPKICRNFACDLTNCDRRA